VLNEPTPDQKELISAVTASFGLSVHSLEFLPIGADARSFSYDCHTDDNRRHYLKLRLIEDESSPS